MDTCEECGHNLGEHFRSIDGKARCLHVDHGMSTGVVMPYADRCDCVDQVSERSRRRKEACDKEERERRQYMDAVLAAWEVNRLEVAASKGV